MRANMRAIQTSSALVVLIAASVLVVVAAHATERHSDTHSEHRHSRHETRHIHAERERYEHPPLHSEGTREDADAYPSFDDPADYRETNRYNPYSDETYDEE
ncbi:hypothetical protein CNR34_00085 [Pseudomonas phage nickie]|uniref:Uncharacterized protein n=1 Tax=Pseudomonas phage nickie TaxID=2048977 RepID=A0A2H4P771_9CAUD|nr:hypothetical protein FDJ16_gp080 [Pseudomonas phage nickie]ATW58018.1 hypothetical protein CNR34_00085 [Pseudomonas phage nickie]